MSLTSFVDVRLMSMLLYDSDTKYFEQLPRDDLV